MYAYAMNGFGDAVAVTSVPAGADVPLQDSYGPPAPPRPPSAPVESTDLLVRLGSYSEGRGLMAIASTFLAFVGAVSGGLAAGAGGKMVVHGIVAGAAVGVAGGLVSAVVTPSNEIGDFILMSLMTATVGSGGAGYLLAGKKR